MAQLSDDCFSGAGRLITSSEALTILSKQIRPVTNITSVPLRAAIGRTLAENIASQVDVPPSDSDGEGGAVVRYHMIGESEIQAGAP